VHSALFSRNALPEDYWRSMSHVIVRIADHGGVIVGRGAHLILSKGLAFRVRLTGSPEVCAHRLARQESISMEDALKRVQEVNKERAGSIEKQFGRSAYDGGAFDLTLNTDRLDPPAAVAVIVHAMKQMGMPVPEEETAAVS
jgi:cytidylate kinase